MALIIGFLTFTRNRDKDVGSDAAKSAVMEAKLDAINAGVSNIQVEIRTNEKRLNEISDKVIINTESIKSAHKRLDHLENKMEG
jgi:tetrahydromethanopterin S-methyltransferase subunit G